MDVRTTNSAGGMNGSGQAPDSNIRSRRKRIAWLAFGAILLVTIAIKIIYLLTAESTADAEEIPLTAVDLVSRGAGAFDIESSRLYGINFITTAISLYLFGFKTVALKLPGLAFFLASTVSLFLLCRRWFENKSWFFQILPCALIALGPPVAQMWALRNRGGFIETWAILAVLLWLYYYWYSRERPVHIVAIMGVLMGVAIWAQPIAVCFVAPISGALMLESLRDGWKRTWISFTWLVASILVGCLPLIAINFLHDMKSFLYVVGGEDSSYFSQFSFFQRVQTIFGMGIPCLLGLKQQWYPQWVLPRAPSLILYVALIFPLGAGFWLALRDGWRSRTITVGVVCTAIVTMVMAANLATSFGSFQMEPRRLLLLYVPGSVLVTLGLIHANRWIFPYLLCFAVVSVASNADYIRTNLNGFQHPAYDDYHDLTSVLQKYSITGVYSGIMIGAKVTFDSSGAIETFRQPYRNGPYGYLSRGEFGQNNAALFPYYEVSAHTQIARFKGDLEVVGIKCHEFMVHDIDVFLGCSRRFNIRELPKEAWQVRTFANAGLIFSSEQYESGAFDDLYARESSFTWTRPHCVIPFYINDASTSGLLVLNIADARQLPDGSVRTAVDGEPVTTEVVRRAGGGLEVRSSSLVHLAHGGHELDIYTDAFLPSSFGSNDPRSLGIPLESATLQSVPERVTDTVKSRSTTSM